MRHRLTREALAAEDLRFEWGIPFDRQESLREQEIDFQFTIGDFF